MSTLTLALSLAAALALAGPAGASGGPPTVAEIVQGRGAGPHPGVLFVHWLGDAPTTNHTEFERDARALAEAGVTSVLVDAMWSRPGWFEAVGRRAAPDVVGVRAQLAELGRALDVLAAQPGVDGRRLALVGHDFGAMFGVVLAADDPRLRWCVLMAGAPTLSEWYLLGKKSPGLEYQRRLGQFDPAKAIGRACSGGILFQFSAHDRYVPAVRAEALVAAARSPKTAISYDAGHDLKLEKAFQDRQAWLRRRLAPAAQRP